MLKLNNANLIDRRITRLKLGQQVNYAGRNCIVHDKYSYIAYLRVIDSKPEEIICVNVGDLVIAGLEPSMTSV